MFSINFHNLSYIFTYLSFYQFCIMTLYEIIEGRRKHSQVYVCETYLHTKEKDKLENRF